MAGFAKALAGPAAEAKALGPKDLFLHLMGGMRSAAGKTVTIKNAVQVSAVFGICKVIGEDIAQVPWKLMQESADGRTRLQAKDHPLYDVLYEQTNEWQDSFQYRETLIWHAILAGKHTSFINRGVDGRVVELIPLDPSLVTVEQRPDYSLNFKVRGRNGESKDFPPEAIFHVRGPSWNGWQGLEVVRLAREAIGLSMAAEESAGALHRNSVRPSGMYSVDGTLKPDQYRFLSDWIQNNNAGAANDGRPLILDRAAKWVSTQMSGVDAQALETRKFEIEEICRYGRVQPIMIGYSDKATTYASAEQMFLAHLVHTLAPWFARLERAANTQLLTKQERKQGYYTKFTEAALLRGSAKDTKDVLLGYVNGGLMTPNEGRAKLDLNPDPDPASDKLRPPANITGKAGSSDASGSEKPDQ